ncbi:MAG: glucose-6-phosphate isomerase family protein [Candidatus Parvarchaeota archaeon]
MMKLRSNLLNLEFDEKEMSLYCDGEKLVPDIRRLSEMSDVLFNRTFINDSNKNDPLYYMFRGVGFGKNSSVFEAHTIRYDITALDHYDLGGEFNKTLGHYHPVAEKGLSFPELYEVLYGEVLYILQRVNPDNSYDVRLVHAKAGDRVIMLPNYGHITVNVGSGILIEANLVNSTFQSNYEPIKQKRGGAVYVLTNNNIAMNRNYNDVKVDYSEAAKIPSLDYSKPTIYDEYVGHPEHFEFLNHPSLLGN